MFQFVTCTTLLSKQRLVSKQWVTEQLQNMNDEHEAKIAEIEKKVRIQYKVHAQLALFSTTMPVLG